MKRDLIPVFILSAVIPLLALPPKFERTAWVTGIPTAAAMAFAPDGRLFIAGDNGAIRIVKNGKLLAGAFATVKNRPRGGSLSGITFDPDFAKNGYVYIVYTYTLGAGEDDRVSRLTSDKANPDAAVAGSELILLEGLGGGGHFSGALHFGKDRMLYVATPTSAAAGHDAGQSTDNIHAKVLRLNPAAYPNIIPPDNPFVGKAGARGEVWALGFREPFSGAIDTVTGTYVINDVGDGKTEEVDVVTKGANYGYPVCEGACNKAGFTDPWASWNHNGMACIAGGAFYYGSNFPPEYRGSYFASDEEEKVIKWRGPDGKFAAWDNLTGTVVDIDVGPDGGLYYLGYSEHTVYRVQYTGPVAIKGATAPAGMGPEASLVRGASTQGVRFLLGEFPASRGSLEIYTRQGKLIASLESGPGMRSLLWPFNGAAPKPDTYLYLLQATASDGNSTVRTGKIVIID